MGIAVSRYNARTDRLLAEEKKLPRDPATGIMIGDEPYFMTGREDMPAVLLIHGFGGVPYDLRPVADRLNGLGYTVSGPLLAGHGTSPEDMARTGWREWYASAEKEYLRLSQTHKHVYVIGFSMGGLLALNLSVNYDFDGMVLLAPCVFLPGEDDLVSTEYLIRHVSPYLPADYVIASPRTVDPDALRGRRAYSLFPLPCLRSMVELMERTRPILCDVNEPFVVIQSVHDGTVGDEGPDYITAHAGSGFKEAVRVENSFHHVARDADRELVVSKVVDFIEDGR